MIYADKNFSFIENFECEDGSEFHNCNFTQKLPNTFIFKDKKNLKFVSCNLSNCKILGFGHEIIDCNLNQKEFCYWLHPNFGLPEEPENCKHVEKIKEVDGKIIYIREE